MANPVVNNWYAGFTVEPTGNYYPILDDYYPNCDFMVNSIPFLQDASGCTAGGLVARSDSGNSTE